MYKYCYREETKAADQLPPKDEENIAPLQPPKKLLTVKGQHC